MGVDYEELVLMAQGPEKVYCYFEISEKTANKFGLSNQEGKLELYSIENQNRRLIKSLPVDVLKGSYYIEIENTTKDVFITYLIKINGEFRVILKSNSISLPIKSISKRDSVKFVDIRNGEENIVQVKKVPLKDELAKYEKELINSGTISSR